MFNNEEMKQIFERTSIDGFEGKENRIQTISSEVKIAKIAKGSKMLCILGTHLIGL